MAGTLLRYPLYWDWELKGFTNCEATLQQLLIQRDTLIATGGLARLKRGYWPRLLRKTNAWIDALAEKGDFSAFF